MKKRGDGFLLCKDSSFVSRFVYHSLSIIPTIPIYIVYNIGAKIARL